MRKVMNKNETHYTNFRNIKVQAGEKLYNLHYNTVILFYHYIANARPWLLNNIKSCFSYLSSTFMTLSLQKCHLATNTEAIDSFGKVGGREAPPNANFSTLVACRAHARVGTHDEPRWKSSRMHRHEPRTSKLKQAGVNAREKVFS